MAKLLLLQLNKKTHNELPQQTNRIGLVTQIETKILQQIQGPGGILSRFDLARTLKLRTDDFITSSGRIQKLREGPLKVDSDNFCAISGQSFGGFETDWF